MRGKLYYGFAASLLLACQVYGVSSTVLLKGGTVITFDPESSSVVVHRDSSILVKDDRIVSIGDKIDSEEISEAEVVDVEGKILTPGFIDAHHHLWQTAYRTTVSNTTLMQYTVRNSEYSPITYNFTAEDVYVGQLAGIYESLNAGVTSILDHAHHTWSEETSLAGLRASVDSGARVFWSYAIRDVGDRFPIPNQIEDFAKLAKDSDGIWAKSPVTVGLAYDMFWTVGPSQAEDILRLARDANASVITCHYAGGAYGAADKNSVDILDRFSALNSTIPIVFSHGTSLNANEASLLRKYNHFIAIVPESDHHYGIGMYNQHLILDQAALGVDTHSTFSGDLITQARFWLQTVRLRLYNRVLDTFNVPSNNPMSVNQAFMLLTRNGAMALRRDDLGVIAPGAKADIAVFRGDSPNMIGWEDPVAAVILHSNVGDIEHVLVDGKFVKRDGELVGLDKDMKERFMASARRIQGVLAATPVIALDGAFLEGSEYVVADTADVLRGPGNGY